MSLAENWNLSVWKKTILDGLNTDLCRSHVHEGSKRFSEGFCQWQVYTVISGAATAQLANLFLAAYEMGFTIKRVRIWSCWWMFVELLTVTLVS